MTDLERILTTQKTIDRIARMEKKLSEQNLPKNDPSTMVFGICQTMFGDARELIAALKRRCDVLDAVNIKKQDMKPLRVPEDMYFDMTQWEAGKVLTEEEAKGVRDLTQDFNDQIGEGADTFDQARKHIIFEIGGQELLDLFTSEDIAESERLWEKVKGKLDTARKEQN